MARYIYGLIIAHGLIDTTVFLLIFWGISGTAVIALTNVSAAERNVGWERGDDGGPPATAGGSDLPGGTEGALIRAGRVYSTVRRLAVAKQNAPSYFGSYCHCGPPATAGGSDLPGAAEGALSAAV
jgi:hypothetical protein